MPKFFEPANFPPTEPAPKPEATEYLSPKIGEGGEVKTLMEWIAPARPFRSKDKSYYIVIAIIVVLLSLIALMANEILIIGVFLAIAFVAYVLAYVPPNDIKYKISTQGITIGEHFYFWHEMDSFWLKEKEGYQVLFLQTYFMFPAQLMLVLKDVDVIEAKKLIARFLPFHEIPRTSFIDRWGEKLQKHLSLENTHA